MRNENIFMARKRARKIGKSGTLPTGSHAPKPWRPHREHQGLSLKQRKDQRGSAKLVRHQDHPAPEPFKMWSRIRRWQ